MFKSAGFFSGGTGSQRDCASAAAAIEHKAGAAQISFNFILHHISHGARKVFG